MLDALFKPAVSAATHPPVETFTAQLAEHEQAVAQWQTTYNTLALEAVDGGRGWAAADEAHESLAKATQARDRTLRMLDAAKRRQANDEEAAARATRNAQWSTAATIAKRRAKKAEQLMASLAAFAADYHAMAADTRELAAAIPPGIASHLRDSMLGNSLADLVRIELSRAGLAGGPPLMGLNPQPLADHYRDSAQAVNHARAEAAETFTTTQAAA